MDNKTLRSIGATLGLLSILMIGLFFYKAYQSGTHNWYWIVMICGMLLLLYYAAIGSNRRR